MLKLFLYPFSWLYGMVMYFRNLFYDYNFFSSTEFEVPVISIGNITVGGTGKTPHVEYMVSTLIDKFNVATLSRGYKRKTKGFRLVQSDSKVEDVGDEPLQIKRKFKNAIVSVCENRVVGVENLVNPKKGNIPDVVILDDAFQHRRITPGINILLIDYNRQLKEDVLLPAGRLREGTAQMKRANMIIFTKCPGEVTPIMQRILMKDVKLKPYQELFFTALDYDKIKPVFHVEDPVIDFYSNRIYSVLVVSGIASPDLMKKHLKPFAKEMHSLEFPDHHNYTQEDILKIDQTFRAIGSGNKIIITTEKDSMRLKDKADIPEELKQEIYFLPVKVKFLENGDKSFNKKILNYVGENKSNRELHQRKNRGKS